MEEKLQQLLQYLIDAIEFGKEQMPLIANEILQYYAIQAWIWIAISVAVIATATFCIFLGIRLSRKEGRLESDCGAEALIIVSSIMGAVFIGVLLGNVFELVKIHIAPRLYLLNYLKSML